MIEKTEIPSKLVAKINIVAPMANMHAKTIPESAMAARAKRRLWLNLFIRMESDMIPSVAKAESKSAVEKIASGKMIQIIPTDIKRFVIGSRDPANMKSKQEIISIRPARTTDIGRPDISE